MNKAGVARGRHFAGQSFFSWSLESDSRAPPAGIGRTLQTKRRISSWPTAWRYANRQFRICRFATDIISWDNDLVNSKNRGQARDLKKRPGWTRRRPARGCLDNKVGVAVRHYQVTRDCYHHVRALRCPSSSRRQISSHLHHHRSSLAAVPVPLRRIILV